MTIRKRRREDKMKIPEEETRGGSRSEDKSLNEMKQEDKRRSKGKNSRI